MSGPAFDISRRSLLGGAVLGGLAASTGALAGTARKPNFLFIMADDMGAFDLSCYGRTEYETPSIDSLARDGMKFELGYANSSTCAPTRVSLISGRYQHRLPIGTGFGGNYPSDTIGYPGGLPSLPSVLKAAGYRTGLIGKWDIGELPTFSPIKSGYDEFFGNMGGGIDYWTHDLQDFPREDRIDDLYENEQPVEADGYATDLFSARACDFIERNSARPFLLSLHYTAPHWPWQSRTQRNPERFSDMHYDGGSPEIYRDMVLAMDEGIGKVLETLRRLDLDRDTVVVFTSDNGGERFSKMWPLRGAKGDLWEGGTRVPLIVRWNGHVLAGSTSRQVVMSMDFLPTFARLAGAPTDPAYAPDGIDITPQLLGGEERQRLVFWKQPTEMLSALEYPWKYLRHGEFEHLYNLDFDETEHANLKLKEPEMFARLQAEAQSWDAAMLKNLRGPPPGMLRVFESLKRVESMR